MTLIITLVTSNKVVQVSDRRLTLNGELYEPNPDATKQVHAICAGASFTVGYTGVAEINGQGTAEWLTHCLGDIFSSGHQDVESVCSRIAQEATSAIAKLRFKGKVVHWKSRGLTLMLAGFGDRYGVWTPFTAAISNIKPNDSMVERKFTKNVLAYPSTLPNPYGQILIVGEDRAFTANDAAARTLNKRVYEVIRILKR